MRRIASPNIFAGLNCLLYKTLNRSDGLFYSLILYGMTRLCKLLCKLLNRPDRLFYPLVLNGLLTMQNTKLVWLTLLLSDTWQLFHNQLVICLCKIPNRSDGLSYLLKINSCCAISSSWVMIINIDYILSV